MLPRFAQDDWSFSGASRVPAPRSLAKDGQHYLPAKTKPLRGGPRRGCWISSAPGW